jgi:hypothetical protein
MNDIHAHKFVIPRYLLSASAIAVLSLAFLTGCGRPESELLDNDLKQAQTEIKSRSGGYVALFAGYAEISRDISDIVTDSFTSTPLYPLKKGARFGARLSGDEAWGVESCSVQAGSRTVQIPIISMVKAGDTVHTVFPATFKAKIDIAAGRTIHSSGYLIITSRAIKAGEPVPVLDVGDGIFSLEKSQSQTKDAADEPSIAVLKDGLTARERVSACEAWLLVNSAAE